MFFLGIYIFLYFIIFKDHFKFLMNIICFYFSLLEFILVKLLLEASKLRPAILFLGLNSIKNIANMSKEKEAIAHCSSFLFKVWFFNPIFSSELGVLRKFINILTKIYPIRFPLWFQGSFFRKSRYFRLILLEA